MSGYGEEGSNGDNDDEDGQGSQSSSHICDHMTLMWVVIVNPKMVLLLG